MNSHLPSLHLTQEEIHQWLSGEPGNGVEEHFRDCPACQVELTQLRDALAGFRSSLEQWPVPAIRRPHGRHAVPRWILVTAGLSLLVAAPVYWNTRAQRVADQVNSDQLLMERVHTGLSRAVPASMEPLMQLVSKEERE